MTRKPLHQTAPRHRWHESEPPPTCADDVAEDGDPGEVSFRERGSPASGSVARFAPLSLGQSGSRPAVWEARETVKQTRPRDVSSVRSVQWICPCARCAGWPSSTSPVVSGSGRFEPMRGWKGWRLPAGRRFADFVLPRLQQGSGSGGGNEAASIMVKIGLL